MDREIAGSLDREIELAEERRNKFGRSNEKFSE